MKKASIVVSATYSKNRLFDMEDAVTNKDNCLYSFYLLREKLLENNIDLATQDINTVEDSEIIFFNDFPKKLPRKRQFQKFYLLALESEAVKPQNFNTRKYKYFDKIFTWNDNVVNHKNVIKLNYSFFINPLKYTRFAEKKKLLCLVSGNKFSNHKNELYTERINAIEYFEANYSKDFDLYGTGWDKAFKSKLVYLFVKRISGNKWTNRFWKLLELIISALKLNGLITKKYFNYKGALSPKIPALQEYKFNLCYENVSVSGYITEKIFDCFFAGCVPIYLGAPNINDYIPVNTFIDKRNFNTYEELYQYLVSISEEKYTEYINAIKGFLKSDQVFQFSAEHFAKTIVDNILHK